MKKIISAILLLSTLLLTVSCGEIMNAINPVTDLSDINGDATEQTGTDMGSDVQAPDGDVEEKKEPVEYMLAESLDKLKLYGRMSAVESGVTCDFTASGIEFNVRAKGDVKLRVTPNKDTYFTVWIDGERLEERFCVPGIVTDITIASFDEMGEHNIKVLKQTEAQWSLCILNSLSFIGDFCEAPKAADKYIEFIGDSIVCGHGNLCMSGDENQGNAKCEDGTLAFAYLTSEILKADHSIIGCSGVGIDKGFTLFSEDDFYPKTSYYRDRNELYSFEQIPDLVVINLGTNDTTKGSGEAAFKAGVKDLIEFVRSKYGKVNIVWTYNMMNDEAVRNWLMTVIEELGGEAEGIYTCKLDRNRQGGNGHPTGDAHDLASVQLVRFIREKGLLAD